MRAAVASWVALVGAGCAITPGTAYPWKAVPLPAPAADFAPEAPVVVLADRRYFDLVGQGRNEATPALFLVHRYLALQVQRPSGLDAGTIELPYALRDFVELSAVAVRPDGERAEVRWSDARELVRFVPSGPDSVERRATVLLVPRVTVGAVIELRYTVRTARWQPSFDEVLDGPWPVLDAEITFRHSIDVALALRSTGFVRHEDVVTGPATLTRFTVSRWRPESLRPLAPFDGTPRVQAAWAYTRNQRGDPEDYAALASWEVAASWLWDDVSALATVEKLPAGVPARVSGGADVAALFDWVQAEIAPRRHLDLRPYRASDAVVRARQGAHYDRALLLYALLSRAQATDVRLVVLPQSERGPLRGWPAAPLSPSAFTFLVRVSVDGAEVYLDPSCVGCRAGELRREHTRRHGLALRPTGKSERLTVGTARTHHPLPVVAVDPVRTPADPVRQPRALELEVELTPRGLRVIDGRWRWRGAEAAGFRVAARDRRGAALRPAEVYPMLSGYAGGGGELTESASGEVTLHLQDALLGTGGYVDAGAHAIVPTTPLVGSEVLDEVEATRAPRDEALSLPRPVGFTSVVRLRVAAGDRVVGLPPPVTLSRAGARYTRSSRQEEASVVVEESLELASDEVAASARPELVRFVRELRAARRQGVVLERAR